MRKLFDGCDSYRHTNGIDCVNRCLKTYGYNLGSVRIILHFFCFVSHNIAAIKRETPNIWKHGSVAPMLGCLEAKTRCAGAARVLILATIHWSWKLLLTSLGLPDRFWSGPVPYISGRKHTCHDRDSFDASWRPILSGVPTPPHGSKLYVGPVRQQATTLRTRQEHSSVWRHVRHLYNSGSALAILIAVKPTRYGDNFNIACTPGRLDGSQQNSSSKISCLVRYQ